MRRTRLCDILGIDYPILQGGMLWLATAELAAAVSKAGALGIISPLAGMERHGDPAENLERQLSIARHLTEKPFGVNIPLDLEYSGTLIDVVLTKRVNIVVTAAGDPRHYSTLLHQEGIRILHVISSVRQAEIAESCGVDAVIAQGIEAAGHHGFDELPLFSLIPQVADSVTVPVIAAGGIVDSRGVVAAISLGAQGVQLGASPRASLSLMKIAKAIALFDGHEFVTPDHVQEIAVPAIAHRMVLDPQARFSGATAEGIVEEILKTIPVPT